MSAGPSDVDGRVKQLIEEAEVAVAELKYDVAVGLLSEARALVPTPNVAILEPLAFALLELGEIDTATALLEACVELSPAQGHEKFLALGQLRDDRDSVGWISRGIALLEQARQEARSSQKETQAASLANDIASAYCCIAETFMSDLCFEDDAETSCDSALSSALAVAPHHIEALQTRASFLLSKCEPEQAKAVLLQSYNQWKDLMSPEADVGVLEPIERESAAQLPLYPFRINTAKLLMEVGEGEEAATVLDRLLLEDDSVIDVYYLMGWLNVQEGEEAAARALLRRALKLNARDGCADEAMLGHIHELVEQLGPGEGDEDLDDTDDTSMQM